MTLRDLDDNPIKSSLAPSEKTFTLKGKDFLPSGTNSFFLEYIPFWKRLDLQAGKQKVMKIVSLLYKAKYLPSDAPL